MSYQDFFILFSSEVASVNLGSEFSSGWLAKLQASLPAPAKLLNAPEFAFFVTALQVYTDSLGDRGAFHDFMQDVAAKVGWIKSKPGGKALAKRLAQASP